jgi:transposase InsO family protein
MAQGFLYLVAIIDWATRAVLAWRLSNTMDTGFCIAALDEAVARHGTPARHIAAPSDRLPKWVKGGCGRQAHGIAGLTPAPEIPRAARHLRFVPTPELVNFTRSPRRRR